MTDSMVERMAQAIYANFFGSTPDDIFLTTADVAVTFTWKTATPMAKRAMRRMARAAIVAMRDPTPAMEAAFNAACDEHGQVLGRYGYKAMIDAALAEGDAAESAQPSIERGEARP